MGKFDKKISKKEPDAPTTQKIVKKKSNAALAELSSNPAKEKERSLKILNWMQKSDEVKHHTKADAHLKRDNNESNYIQKKIAKTEKKKRKQ